jgi:phosphonate degradation associated HDIG domain protein
MTQPQSLDVVDAVARLFAQRGRAAYLGEAVTQTEHALQTALAAERAGSPAALIAAGLLHDVGHLLWLEESDGPDGTPQTDDQHEQRGQRWLARHFGPAVTEPVRLHVAAKRFLCATDPSYHALLSPASQASLRLQGGPMSTAEAEAFRSLQWAESAVALRRWDDEAKVPGLATPELSHFLRYVEASLVRQS